MAHTSGGEVAVGAIDLAPDAVRVPRWVAFFVLSWSAVGALLWAARSAGAWPPWFLLVLLVGLSVPIFLYGTWCASLRRAHELRLFQDGGRLRRLLGGPMLRSVIWLVAAPALALAVIIGAAGENRSTLAALLVPLAICLLFLVADRALRDEVTAPHRLAMALRTAVFFVPVLLVAADFAASLLWGDIVRYATLAEAVRANIPQEPSRSQSVDELIRLAAYMNAMEAFALGSVADWGGTFRLTACFGIAALNLAFYAGLARVVALFVLPRAELRRALLPASDLPMPRRLSTSESAVISALSTVLLVFILIPALAVAEAWLKHNRPSIYVAVSVEMIDGLLVNPGTIEILDKLRSDTVAGLNIDQEALAWAANAGFDAMARNVDAYLDAYYSLPAEYLRLGSLVMGGSELEQRLTDDLNGHLMAGEPFATYEARLSAALASADRVRDIYDAGVARVIDLAALDLPPDARIDVVASTSREYLALPVPAVVAITSRERAAASAAAGGIVAALVVKKVVAKGTLKLAAKAVAKVTASKAAGASGGAGVGALAGAAVGSVVPVIGTTAGAVVGGVIGGLAVGVGVDYLMLQLEEAWSRDAFRQQILDAIEAQRAAFLAGLAPER